MDISKLETELYSFKHLEDLLNVGKTKLVGYLPLALIKLAVGKKRGIINKLQVWVKEKGLKSKIMPEFREGSIGASEALYVWEEKGLKEFLYTHSVALKRAGIPIDPEEYIDYIARFIVWKEKFPKAYEIIGKSFNDPRWRK